MTETKKIREWARDNGYDVSARGAMPRTVHDAYYEAHEDERPADWVGPLPGPDDADDIGLTEPDYGPAFPAPERSQDGPRTFRAVEDAGDGGTGASDDTGPAHARKDWRGKGRRERGGGSTPRPGRVTGGIRNDIRAKIEFALAIPGSLWAARDPLCGGVFMEQVPETADAFTDIVCDSADLIAFFTGSGNTFMKALKVGAALMPVGQVIMAHHVYHTVDAVITDAQQPGYQDQYAA